MAVLLLGSSPVSLRAQAPGFEQVVSRLSSTNVDDRLAALALLKESGYREAQVPVAALLTDPVAAVRLEAIATEMNCFLATKLVGRSHVALVIEVRNKVSAAAAFGQGPLAVAPQPLPSKVQSELLVAATDSNPGVALEAVYALGVVGPLATGAARTDLLRGVGARVATLLRSPDTSTRRGALDVLGRVADDYGATVPPIDQTVGDAVVAGLNDSNASVRAAAVGALGRLRYARAVGALTDRYRYYRRGSDAAAALEALARIAYPTSLPVFESALASDDPGVRAAAVEGIARTGAATQVNDVLRRLGAERSDRVNLALNFAAARTGQRVVLQPFVAVLGNEALEPAAIGDLLELTASGRAGADSWQAALNGAPAARRLTLVHVIGMAGDDSLVPVLEPLLHDADAKIASAARMATERLRQIPARP